jgi:hypothetical protein
VIGLDYVDYRDPRSTYAIRHPKGPSMTEPELTQLEASNVLRASLVRHHRQRCVRCGKRRVLFQVTVTANADTALAATQRLCAECSGIR